MDKKFIIDHVNKEHNDALENIYKTYINKKYKKILFLDFDLKYIYLNVDNKKEKIPFNKPLKSFSDFKNAFIEMSKKSKDGFDAKKVKTIIDDFVNSYNSVVLATVMNNNPIASTAPILRYKDNLYIYISEMAEHYSAIKKNPNKIRLMFLEDEKLAYSPFNRKRVIYQAKAKFVTDKKEFNLTFNNYIKRVGSGGGIEMIKNMKDFHLIRLELVSGKAYLGFGQAYLIKNNKILILNTGSMGHK
ncbi:DUF2470 domain-containing protein [Mycoplasmoides pirum]|uniref:pyridoxamine 5'-phosphate oxidase family protein n=1 Tax=Mycoplasmoides pirum TaxID=2122 RepID=UPI000483680B|nr:DUF2470 domain-containing protein [Mycoplasmoides pirum]